MLEKFSIASLAKLDGGRVREAFEREIAKCEDDCRDRPRLEKPRRVTITISMTPVSESNELESCDVSFSVKSALPPKDSRKFNMLPGDDGLRLNELSPDEARQHTIDEVEESDENVQRGKGPKAVAQ